MRKSLVTSRGRRSEGKTMGLDLQGLNPSRSNVPPPLCQDSRPRQTWRRWSLSSVKLHQLCLNTRFTSEFKSRVWTWSTNRFSQLKAFMTTKAVNHLPYIELQWLYKEDSRSTLTHSELSLQNYFKKREIKYLYWIPTLLETWYRPIQIVRLLT